MMSCLRPLDDDTASFSLALFFVFLFVCLLHQFFFSFPFSFSLSLPSSIFLTPPLLSTISRPLRNAAFCTVDRSHWRTYTRRTKEKKIKRNTALSANTKKMRAYAGPSPTRVQHHPNHHSKHLFFVLYCLLFFPSLSLQLFSLFPSFFFIFF